MSKRIRTLVAGGLLGVLGISACGEDQGFMDPEKHRETFISFRNVAFVSQQKREFRITVGDIVHPHFEGRWTLRDKEKPVDVYVIRAQDYDPNLLPPAQPRIFWDSVVESQGGLQQLQSTTMQVHPSPGEWVVVFYNPAPLSSTARAEVSADMQLTFFR